MMSSMGSLLWNANTRLFECQRKLIYTVLQTGDSGLTLRDLVALQFDYFVFQLDNLTGFFDGIHALSHAPLLGRDVGRADLDIERAPSHVDAPDESGSRQDEGPQANE